MRYPIELRFKILALASQIYATDADGNQLFYIKQKLLKLREKVEIYTDSSKTQLLYTVKADRIIDFSPESVMYDANDQPLGRIKRFGSKSIWKATYEITLGDSQPLTVKETNPWAKVADVMLAQIPILGLLSGYLFHPHYEVTDASGEEVASLTKQPAFFESSYRMEKPGALGDEDAERDFAAIMMIVTLRERIRG